jgi:hypothetical protein
MEHAQTEIPSDEVRSTKGEAAVPGGQRGEDRRANGERAPGTVVEICKLTVKKKQVRKQKQDGQTLVDSNKTEPEDTRDGRDGRKG